MCRNLAVVLLVISAALHVRSPEGQVITKELHDESAVLVAVLGEGVKISDGIIESLLGKTACAVGRRGDLVVEHREVEGKAKTDGVSGRKVLLSDLAGSLVGLKGVVRGLSATSASGELSKVAVIITLHLVVEDLALVSAGRGDEVLVKKLKDVRADAAKLALDLLAVLADGLDVSLVALLLLLLLDGAHNPPRGTTGADDVLVSNAEKVTLLNGELEVHLTDLLHGLNHLIIALSLLSELCKIYIILTLRHDCLSIETRKYLKKCVAK